VYVNVLLVSFAPFSMSFVLDAARDGNLDVVGILVSCALFDAVFIFLTRFFFLSSRMAPILTLETQTIVPPSISLYHTPEFFGCSSLFFGSADGKTTR
jgi:hypothetical protein